MNEKQIKLTLTFEQILALNEAMLKEIDEKLVANFNETTTNLKIPIQATFSQLNGRLFFEFKHNEIKDEQGEIRSFVKDLKTLPVTYVLKVPADFNPEADDFPEEQKLLLSFIQEAYKKIEVALIEFSLTAEFEPITRKLESSENLEKEQK